jgi:hypothetical protein
MSCTSPPESALSLLTPEQHSVASQIIDAMMQKTDQPMFLEESAGTGKTFTVKAVIKAVESTRKKCLICGTTGIAAVQYPGGTTLHSLSHLGIDEQFRGSFRSNVGRGTPLPRHILAGDLIIIDGVSMLTPWVTNRVSMTLQSISGQYQQESGGKQILFVSDLLQLSSAVSNFWMPLSNRLITRLSYWSSIRKFQPKRPIRAPEPSWADFLLSNAKGQTRDIQDWRELQIRFRVTATQNIETAQSFFCIGLEPHDPFRLDRQWICATNKLMNHVNHHFQQWGSQKA